MTIIIYPDNTHTIDGVESGRFNGSLPIGDEVLEIPLERPGDLNRADKFKLKGGYEVCVYYNNNKSPGHVGRWYEVRDGRTFLMCGACHTAKDIDEFYETHVSGGGFHRGYDCIECKATKKRAATARLSLTFKRKRG